MNAMTCDIVLQQEPLRSADAVPGGSGAAVRFEGRVRPDENGVPITALEYEAYQPMAERQIGKILSELAGRHPCLHARVHHRLGRVPVGETAIVVEVFSTHRAEAFALASAFMDRLKQDVPIWKVRAVPADA